MSIRAKALIEHHLDRQPRVRTTEDDSERVLLGGPGRRDEVEVRKFPRIAGADVNDLPNGANHLLADTYG